VALCKFFSLDDPLDCQTVFPSADVQLFPTAKGIFHAKIAQIFLKQVWMHRIHISLPEINTVAVKPGRKSFGFLTERNSPSLLDCGLEVRPGDMVINRSDAVHQRSGANFHYGTVSLPSDDLAAASRAIVGRSLPEKPNSSIVRPPFALMGRLLELHKSIGKLADLTPEILEHPEVSRALENKLTHIMVRCLAEGQYLEPSTGARRGGTVLSRLLEFLEAHAFRPIYLAEICAAIGIAERTLRSCCERHLGMGPVRYLTFRRMHLVRRALQRSDPSVATVTEIVTDHGFFELGRFSVAYRMLFGESPSETLRVNSPGIAPIRCTDLGPMADGPFAGRHWQPQPPTSPTLQLY
jgi:AraC-like DNA-binding protein